MDTGVLPNYLSSLIPASVEDSTIYNLRNANNLRHTLTRTQLYYIAFLPSIIRAWNDLALEVRQSSSIQSFKYQLNKNLKRPPKYYYAGNPLYQIRHTRLRTDCSALNNHLFSNHIVDSPHCACGAVETTKHYFFECQRYNEVRTIMLNELGNYRESDLNTVHFGIHTSDFNTNHRIMITVQKYILDSKRFGRWGWILSLSLSLSLSVYTYMYLYSRNANWFEYNSYFCVSLDILIIVHPLL